MRLPNMCVWCRTYLEEELMKAKSKEIMRKVNPIMVWWSVVASVICVMCCHQHVFIRYTDFVDVMIQKHVDSVYACINVIVLPSVSSDCVGCIDAT